MQNKQRKQKGPRYSPEVLGHGTGRVGESGDLRGGGKLTDCLSECALQPRCEYDENLVVDLVKYLLGLLKEVEAGAGDSDRVPPGSHGYAAPPGLDESLGAGLGANAAAVLAVTLSALVPGLPGPDVVDRDGTSYPGLIPIGLPILKASRADLHAMYERARRMAGVTVVTSLRTRQASCSPPRLRPSHCPAPTQPYASGRVAR